MTRVGIELGLGFVGVAIIAVFTTYQVGAYRQEMRALNLPPAVPAANQLSVGQPTVLSAESVAQHNTPSDCWIIIVGKVYGVGGYLTQHPGGARRITPYCGQDATQAFASRGGTGQHSLFAQQELALLLLGPVGGSADQSVISNANQNAAAALSGRGGDNEYEDD